MEVLDIGVVRPDILTPTILTVILFWRMKVLKCLHFMEDMDRGLLRPANIPLVIVDFITVVTILEADLGLNIPATITLAML